jgi:hypothetical protein
MVCGLAAAVPQHMQRTMDRDGCLASNSSAMAPELQSKHHLCKANPLLLLLLLLCS